MPDLLTEYIQH